MISIYSSGISESEVPLFLKTGIGIKGIKKPAFCQVFDSFNCVVDDCLVLQYLGELEQLVAV